MSDLQRRYDRMYRSLMGRIDPESYYTDDTDDTVDTILEGLIAIQRRRRAFLRGETVSDDFPDDDYESDRDSDKSDSGSDSDETVSDDESATDMLRSRLDRLEDECSKLEEYIRARPDWVSDFRGPRKWYEYVGQGCERLSSSFDTGLITCVIIQLTTLYARIGSRY